MAMLKAMTVCAFIYVKAGDIRQVTVKIANQVFIGSIRFCFSIIWIMYMQCHDALLLCFF